MSRYPLRSVRLVLVCAFIFSCSVLAASAATWTVHAQPTRLVNGAPVLFQVKPPAILDSLTGTWPPIAMTAKELRTQERAGQRSRCSYYFLAAECYSSRLMSCSKNHDPQAGRRVR